MARRICCLIWRPDHRHGPGHQQPAQFFSAGRADCPEALLAARPESASSLLRPCGTVIPRSRKDRAQPIDQRRPLTDQPVPCPMQGLQGELVLRFQGDKTHGRTFVLAQIAPQNRKLFLMASSRPAVGPGRLFCGERGGPFHTPIAAGKPGAVQRPHGRMNTLMQPSFLSRKVLYASGPSSRPMR